MASCGLIFIIILFYCQQSYQSKINLIKCCPINEHIRGSNCTQSFVGKDFSGVAIYSADFIKTNEQFQDLFDVVQANVSIAESTYNLNNVFLINDGTLRWRYESPNSFPQIQIFTNFTFCIDHIEIDTSNTLIPNFWTLNTNMEDDMSIKKMYFAISALLISCVFLTLVLIVYILIPELRNIFGKMIMGCVSSLLGAYLSLATTQIILMHNTSPSKALCVSSTFVIFFFLLSSSCWMTTLAFQLWRSFRKIIHRERSTRQRDHIIFIRCGLFSWGLPLILCTFIIGIDNIDLTHIPWFIKPHISEDYGCFIEGKTKLLYLYTPMLVLIICNWILFLTTACNLWVLYKDTGILKREKRLILFIQNQLKMSIIIGLSWILEVISAIFHDLDNIWYITDAYNMLIGVAFFIIFVCKKKILKKIFNRRDPALAIPTEEKLMSTTEMNRCSSMYQS